MSVQPNGPAPYAPPQAVLSVINRYRDHGLREPFDTEVLIMAGVSESLAPRTLQAFKLLELVDEGGHPTEALRQLAHARSDEYQERLGEIIRGAYADVFAFADPASDDIRRIEDAFRGYTPRGQRNRMVTLFLGLCQEAGIVQTPPRRQAVESANPQVRSAKQPKAVAKKAPKTNAADVVTGDIPRPLAALLGELPVPGVPWTKERRDTFLLTFGALLDFLYPVRPDVVPFVEDDKGL